MMNRTLFLGVLVASCLLVGRAAAADVAASCESVKNRSAGRLAACIQSAAGKLAIADNPAAYAAAVAKCVEKFDGKFDEAERKASSKGGACPVTGDAAAIAGAISARSECIADALAGDASCLLCGNAQLDPGEDCDIGLSVASTCGIEAGLSAGTLACGSDCHYDTSGCAAAPCNLYTTSDNLLGACWYLGASWKSCTETCAAESLVYDPATESVAGSGGSDVNCWTVLTSFPTAPVSDNPGTAENPTDESYAGLGCFTGVNYDYARDTRPTTPDAKRGAHRRACACR